MLSRAGLIGVAAGVIGGLAAVVLIFWPPQVAPGPVHYPFTVAGFIGAQVFFFVHHLALVLLLVAFARSGAAGAGPLRLGAWLAVAGMTLLSLNELNCIRYATADFATANNGALGALYGISCNLTGLGLILSGAGAVRARVWTGWRRFMPLAVGIATFVELTPGMFGGFVIARLAIGTWMLLFAALGWALHVEASLIGTNPVVSPSV